MWNAAGWASSVTVDITGIDPDPAWMDTPVTVQAAATFSADGREQEQAVLGWIPQFRGKWEFLSDGSVTDSEPALDPQTPGWSEWSPLNSATGTGTFPTGLVKQAKVTVQVRMTPAVGPPSAVVCQGVATEALDVWELKDVTNLHVVRFEPGVAVLAWDQADCPGVAGYKYHVEPDRNTLIDVGQSTQITIPNLTAGQTYTVGVHTYDTLGHMTHTATLSFTMPTPPLPVPVLLAFPTPGGDGVDILWAPSSDPSVVNYEVTVGGVPTTVTHNATIPFYHATAAWLTEGVQICVQVRVNISSTPPVLGPPRESWVTPVPFQDTHELQRKIDEKHLALTGSSSGVGWTTSLSSLSALTEMRYALILLNERSFVDESAAGAFLSYYTGYDSYGADRGAPYLPAHFMDTSWPCIPIPGATGWLPTPALSYFNLAAKTNLTDILGLITLWRSAANDGCTVVSNDAATDLGVCSLWSSISWDNALSRSAFAFQTRYYPTGGSAYFGFQGSAHFENDFFDWWLVDMVQDTCVRVERHFPPNPRVDQYFWTDKGACSPDGTLVKDYPFGGVPTSSTWGDPDGSPTHVSTGYSYYGRITDNIYALCKTVNLAPPTPPEFQYQPSATITYAGVGQKIPVWVKVKYDNPLDSTKPVWIPAKVECADANAFICNQGCDDPNGDCGSGSSVFVALAPGTYTLSAVGGTRTVIAIGVTTETYATTPSDRSRKKIGIGETVVCSLVPPVSATWSVTGGGNLSWFTGSSTAFTASMSPSTSTVRAQFEGADCTVTFAVVEPTGMTAVLASDTAPGSPGTDRIGARSVFNCQVQPTDVSFYAVSFREHIPGETYTWPDGTLGTRTPATVVWQVSGFDNSISDAVSSGLFPVARLFNGTTYVDFSHTVRVPEEYLNESGEWVVWLSGEKHPRDYRGTDFRARTKLQASNTAVGGWMGPWQ